MFGRSKENEAAPPTRAPEVSGGDDPLATIPKSQWERIWPVLACGSGLFSDGYINNVIGAVSTLLGDIYGTEYTGSSAQQNITAITFVGTVVGQLFFGYLSDKWSRTNSLLLSTVILIVFAALGAGAYGFHGSATGMFAGLTAYRFLVGIGIGGEYPAGSVACSEATGELKAGTRNRWFIIFTNTMIDISFVVGAFIPYLMVVICTDKHLRLAWRLSLGLGVVPPLLLLYLRLKLQEPEEFKRESMKDVKTPYWLVIKFYWWRLLIVSLIWFLYDFNSYSFGLYTTSILQIILGQTASHARSFGWSVVINLFYIPGAVGGSFVSDWIGPRYSLAIGVLAQAVVGFIMAGLYHTLATPAHVAGFVVVYGIFLSLGELGPGDNIGLIASKTSATGIRGEYYAIAAAFGKIGAFIGTYAFKAIAGPNLNYQNTFFVSSAFCVLSGLLTLFCLPHIGQDTITLEDIRFREYLDSHGWDVRQLGLLKGESVESVKSQTSDEVIKAQEKVAVAEKTRAQGDTAGPVEAQ